jgi:hypothetical protein
MNQSVCLKIKYVAVNDLRKSRQESKLKTIPYLETTKILNDPGAIFRLPFSIVTSAEER